MTEKLKCDIDFGGPFCTEECVGFKLCSALNDIEYLKIDKQNLHDILSKAQKDVAWSEELRKAEVARVVSLLEQREELKSRLAKAEEENRELKEKTEPENIDPHDFLPKEIADAIVEALGGQEAWDEFDLDFDEGLKNLTAWKRLAKAQSLFSEHCCLGDCETCQQTSGTCPDERLRKQEPWLIELGEALK